MDAVRFLNFLHDFAANAAQKTSNNTAVDGKTPAADLAATFTAFESQLRALMNPGETSTPDTTNSLTTPSDTPEFVTGGKNQSSALSDKTLAATEAMLAMVSERNLSAQTLSSPPPSPTPSPENDELKKISAWRREQIDPMLHIKVGDIWDRQGITDPLNHPKLLAEAQHSQEVALSRKAHMPGFVAQWEGDWRAELSSERQANEIRRNELTAASSAHGFIIGGAAS
jgi:hypothetical protein